MSRKTRKLIWSAPLVAVLAVAGALAIFVALSPQEAAAHEAAMHGAPGSVSGLTANPATDDPNTPKPEGRNAITLTWEMPTSGGAAETYRIDISEDTRVWTNLEPAYTDASAEAHCPASSADNLRCYTSTNLEPGTRYNYRVFAENTLGISPVSVEPTYDFAITADAEAPSRVMQLSASTSHVDKIVLNWSAPADDGGMDVLWYCLAVTTQTENFATTLTDATCRDATAATGDDAIPGFNTQGVFTTDAVIVVPRSATSYEHTGLDDPETIALRYRAYAVTDPDGKADTTAGRLLAPAASNIATGRTVAPGREFGDPPQSPLAVRNLRAVVFGDSPDADGDFESATANLYWNKPTNFPDADRGNWRVEVQEWNGTEWGDVTGAIAVGALTAPTAPAAPAQLTITDADALVGEEPGTGTYQVRYVIDESPDDTDDSAASDINGVWAEVKVLERRDPRLPLAPTQGDAQTGLPSITVANGNTGTGLRFRHGDNPRTEIDLFWDLDNSADSGMNRLPTGYVLDVSEDGGITWEPLRNVTSPVDLGATIEYTHRGVTPGKRYTYRVFPEQGHAFGLPMSIHASSEGAEVPDPVDGLTVTADGQKALVLNWHRVPASGNGGHEIMGYLVQVSGDVDNDTINDNEKGTTGATATTWMSLGVVDTADPTSDDFKPWTVGPTTTTYRYEPKNGLELSAGNLRWFRVFAITAENDSDPNTGGQRINESNGEAITVLGTEASPAVEDIESADEEDGRTDSLPDPGPSTPTTPPPAPVDLTAEVASDTNEEFATSRGVLLLWNEPEDGDDITSYVIQRSVDGGAWETIDEIEWLGTPIKERTSYTDDLEPAPDEVRMYQVGSRSTATGDPLWSAPVMYPAVHPEGHMPGALTAVRGLDAEPGSTAGTAEVSWTPGNNATMHWIYAIRADEMEGGYTFMQTSSNNSHTLTGLDSDVEYIVAISAGRGQLIADGGDGGEWSAWMYIRVTPD